MTIICNRIENPCSVFLLHAILLDIDPVYSFSPFYNQNKFFIAATFFLLKAYFDKRSIKSAKMMIDELQLQKQIKDIINMNFIQTKRVYIGKT